MNRWKASALHFAVSLVVFIALVAVIVLVWYPGLLFELNGGWEGLRIVIAVDLVLGPLLTLIVFKQDKPSLKFDLTSIAIFQSICLIAGMWLVYQERPVVLVLEHDTVFSLSAREFSDLGNEAESLSQFSGSYPKFVSIELPNNDQEAAQLAIDRQLNGNPLYGQVENYRDISTAKTEFRRLNRLDDRLRADALSQQSVEFPENCVVVKFASSSTTGFICLDVDQGIITDYF